MGGDYDYDSSWINGGYDLSDAFHYHDLHHREAERVEDGRSKRVDKGKGLDDECDKD